MTTPGLSASSAIPFKSPSDSSLPSDAQWLVAVVMCVLALCALLLWLKRRHPSNSLTRVSSKGLCVVTRAALTPQTQLLVVTYGDRDLLLSVGPNGVQCLRDDPAGNLKAQA